MGFEHGSIICYNKAFWLFEGYSSNTDHQQTYKLRGVDGEQVEALESECRYLISPSEINWNY